MCYISYFYYYFWNANEFIIVIVSFRKNLLYNPKCFDDRGKIVIVSFRKNLLYNIKTPSLINIRVLIFLFDKNLKQK